MPPLIITDNHALPTTTADFSEVVPPSPDDQPAMASVPAIQIWPKTRRPKGSVKYAALTISAIPKAKPANQTPASTRGRPRAARKLRQYALSQKPFPKNNQKEKAFCKFLFPK